MRQQVRALLALHGRGGLGAGEAARTLLDLGISEDELENYVPTTLEELEFFLRSRHFTQKDLAQKLNVHDSVVTRAKQYDPIRHRQVNLATLETSEEMLEELKTLLRNLLGGQPAGQRGAGETIMTLDQLNKAQAATLLTRARSIGTNGAMTAYFYFKAGQLVAADHAAYEEDGQRLKTGFNAVEAPAVLHACEAVEAVLPQIAPSGGPIGGFRALILGFSDAIVTMTLAGEKQHLVGLSYPKSVYRYRSAYSAKLKLLDLLGSGPAAEYPRSELQDIKKIDPFAAGISYEGRKEGDPAFENLHYITDPGRLQELFSNPQFEDTTESGLQGFALFRQDPADRNRRHMVAASGALLERTGGHNSGMRLKEPFGAITTDGFKAHLFSALTSAQAMLRDARDLIKITGRLRTFWITFENMVVGINPFLAEPHNSRSDQYFLVSICGKRPDGELPFNYQQARASIRLVCSMAGDI